MMKPYLLFPTSDHSTTGAPVIRHLLPKNIVSLACVDDAARCVEPGKPVQLVGVSEHFLDTCREQTKSLSMEVRTVRGHRFARS